MNRWIDADALIEKEERYELDSYIDGERCYEMAVPSCAIIEAPSIDIVRCGECKYRQNPYAPKWCYEMSKETNADDFCSYGSRSEKPNNSKVSDIPTGSERSSDA